MVAVLLVAAICFAPGFVLASERHVLLVSSYHPGFPTFFQQIEGLKSVLAPAGVKLDVEFMDSKRFYTPQHLSVFRDMLAAKLAKLPPYDVVVTSDDNALNFALENRAELFPTSPVVFCGVNNIALALTLNDNDSFTGVIEAVSLPETLTAIEKLRPKAKAIHVIVDSTPSGRADWRRLQLQKDYFPGLNLKPLFLETLSWSDFAAALRDIPKQDAVLLLSAYRDVENQAKTFEEGLELISANAGAPVFHLWEHGVGQGLLGGKIISHYEQGRVAGDLVLKILGGENAGEIPVVGGDAANKYVFDHDVMSRFSIPAATLPAGATLLNKPYSFFETHWRELMLLVALLLGLLLIIAALLFYAFRLRKTEEALRNSELLLNTSQEIAAVGGWEWDAEKHATTWTEETYRIHGMERFKKDSPPEEYVEQSLLCYAPEDRPAVRAAFEACIDKGEPYDLVFPFTSRKGRKLWIRTTGQPIEEHGKVTKVVGALVDITQQVQASKELAESERMYRILADNAEDVIWTTDSSYRYTYVSPSVKKLLGFSPKELLQNHARETLTPQSRDLVVEELARVFDAQNAEPSESMRVEVEQCRKDGDVVWIEAVVRRMFDEQGEHTGFLGVSRDISQRKKAQDALLEAKEIAEAASKSKSEFLANMSHEIRTPLNGVMGLLQLIEDKAVDSEVASLVQTAIQSSRRLSVLLSDILDLSRVEAGRMEILFEDFDFFDTIQGVEELFSPTAKQKGLDLTVSIDPQIPRRVRGDAIRLQQILNNLVGNAIKFTETGHVAMDARHRFVENRTHFLEFKVSDTGIGIHENDQKNLFTAFTQVERNYQRRYQGAGLGLAIAKNLVDLMGGDIAVQSHVGQGAAFTFTLPFDEAGAGPEKGAGSISSPLGKACTILVAEDDEVCQLTTSKMLMALGHVVHLAGDGDRVLEMIMENNYDLVMMDVQMPQLDGVEATRIIRSGKLGEEVAKVPIIATTAYAMVGDKEKFLAAGMNGYLAKPFDKEGLEEVLGNMRKDSLG